MSAILDAAALRVRHRRRSVLAFASSGEPSLLFDGLVSLLVDVLTYRWMAVLPARPQEPLFVHCHPSEGRDIEAVVRSDLGIPATLGVASGRTSRVATVGGPLVEMAITFGGIQVGGSRSPHRARASATITGRSPSSRTSRRPPADERHRDAQRLATTDALTNLLNRRVARRHRASARRSALVSHVSLLLDIDHFKEVNDSRGHAAGDAVLQGVARILMAVARRSDCGRGRWGGEEFVVFLPQTGEAGARIAAERIRRAIAESTHAVLEGPPVRITPSIGLERQRPRGPSRTWRVAADAAMYAAKGRGRNRVELYSSEEVPPSPRRMREAVLASSK